MTDIAIYLLVVNETSEPKWVESVIGLPTSIYFEPTPTNAFQDQKHELRGQWDFFRRSVYCTVRQIRWMKNFHALNAIKYLPQILLLQDT